MKIYALLIFHSKIYIWLIFILYNGWEVLSRPFFLNLSFLRIVFQDIAVRKKNI